MATTSEEVWRILGELAEAQKETEQQTQETKGFMDPHLRETERLLQQQNQQLNDQLNKWGNCVGEFVKWQVRPAVAQLFGDWGIVVHEFCCGASAWRGDESIEIDLLAASTMEAILVGAKSKLTQSDVDEHLERLSKFKRLMPRYNDVRAMGAVAAMVVPDEVARYAYRKGLFVMVQSGDSMVILNDDSFKPKTW